MNATIAVDSPATLSPAAVAQWARILHLALTVDATRQIIVPLCAYEAGSDSDGNSLTCLPPLVAEKWEHQLEKVITDHLQQHVRTLRAGEHLALGRHIAALSPTGQLTVAKLDIWDARPGLKADSSHPLAKRYAFLRTTGSFHLYPIEDPFEVGGGETVADAQWELGFLRVTEASPKGSLELAWPFHEPIPF